jgi:hypothetical protein
MSSSRYGDVHLLETAGLIGACAASLGVSEDWPAPYLRRIYSQVGLDVPNAAVRVLVDDSCALASVPDVTSRAAALATAHANQLFEVGGGSRVIRKVLAADVLMTGAYDARSRETCLRVLGSLDLPPRVLFDIEREISASLSEEMTKARIAETDSNMRKEDGARRTRTRWLKIGGATVLGGVALGVSGGLLAPALLPALGSLGLAGAAGVTGTSATMAVGGLFGVAGASFGANAMANRTSEVKEFLFEKCTCVPVIGPPGEFPAGCISGNQGRGVITPEKRIFEVVIPLGNRGTVSGSAEAPSLIGVGMLVWEFTTSQDTPMVVPAGIKFGVTFTSQAPTSSSKSPSSEMNGAARRSTDWMYSEEELDAGGIDKHGNGKLNRHTGALTVTDSGDYIMRWRLLPGSHAVDIQYRYALVPPGVEPPVFIMKERGHESVNTFNGLSTIDRPRSLSVVVFVPGLLQQGANHEAPGVIVEQFAAAGGAVACLQGFDLESFGLRWETKQLADVSKVLNNVVRRFAVRVAAQEGARILAPALVGALALPVTLVVAMRSAIDNVWATTLSRARSAAILLAESLSEFGRRPITLAGYSAGAGMIFWALEELARQKRFGVIHDVYLVGAPIPCDLKRWEVARSVVSGRFVNGFWPGDWFLEVAQRTTTFNSDALTGIAGTSPVRISGGSVENVDLSRICERLNVGNHANFSVRATHIFVALGLGNGRRRRPWPSDEDESDDLGDEYFDSGLLDAQTPRGVPLSLKEGKVDGEWVCASATRDSSSECGGGGNPSRLSGHVRLTRSLSERSLSRSAAGTAEGYETVDDTHSDVVVFTNRRRRHVQSAPPPLLR